MVFRKGSSLLVLLLAGWTTLFVSSTPVDLEACPGYKAINVQTTASTLRADLVLNGKPCNVYGPDIERLVLEVEYEESESSFFLSFPSNYIT